MIAKQILVLVLLRRLLGPSVLSFWYSSVILIVIFHIRAAAAVVGCTGSARSSVDIT